MSNGTHWSSRESRLPLIVGHLGHAVKDIVSEALLLVSTTTISVFKGAAKVVVAGALMF